MSHATSVIIPTLNESASIGDLIAALKHCTPPVEVIVADGGSTDDTVERAKVAGVKVIRAQTGRGSQMHAGAVAAEGDVLWFIHADTIPPPVAAGAIASALRSPGVVAGNFTIKFDGDYFAAVFLTWLYPKLRLLGLVYGDSAIFVRRDVYERVGGFRPFPLFEDLDLIGRLKSEGQILTLPVTVITSSRRFENRSFVITLIRWILLQLLYWVGVSPSTLGRMYHPVRKQ